MPEELGLRYETCKLVLQDNCYSMQDLRPTLSGLTEDRYLLLSATWQTIHAALLMPCSVGQLWLVPTSLIVLDLPSGAEIRTSNKSVGTKAANKLSRFLAIPYSAVTVKRKGEDDTNETKAYCYQFKFKRGVG